MATGDYIMPDITMCEGTDCPFKNECYLHRTVPSKYRQSFFAKPPYNKEKNSCDYFTQIHDWMKIDEVPRLSN